ncbi:MAG TPA: hypothetical protein VFT61_05030 [Sphingomicrobium sp.]|nr:hypothetical protein [Sphingomicrobium sp.]
MRSTRKAQSRIDALDLAAIWPCCAQVAGPSLPPLEPTEPCRRLPPDQEDRHGIW